MPKKKRSKKQRSIKKGGIMDSQTKKIKIVTPARDPNVPGAGSLVPTGPRVLRFLTSQSIFNHYLQ